MTFVKHLGSMQAISATLGLRTAEVRGARDAEQVARYMPSNYAVAGEYTDEFGGLVVIVTGQDYAGWTMDDYIIPRLGSGMIYAREVTSE